MEKIFNFNLCGERIKIIKAEDGAHGADGQIGKVLSVSGKGADNDLIIQLEDDKSIWNIGDANKVKYNIL